tara:strand:+ start:249 stop:551 length:303 start_codon:yes stop_codon:yes gene_type:complete
MAKSQKNKTREKCSWLKGHEEPSPKTYQEDLYNWYCENACRGEYKDIRQVANAIGRLRDYLHPQCEWNSYGWPSDLNQKSRDSITQRMLYKIEDFLRSFK